MREAKVTWTSGPWRVAENAHGIRCVVESDAHRVAVSYRTSDPLRNGPSAVESEANARLIAAAPTMASYIQKRAEAGDAEAQAIWEAAVG